jgi:hypothetical protein
MRDVLPIALDDHKTFRRRITFVSGSRDTGSKILTSVTNCSSRMPVGADNRKRNVSVDSLTASDKIATYTILLVSPAAKTSRPDVGA